MEFVISFNKTHDQTDRKRKATDQRKLFFNKLKMDESQSKGKAKEQNANNGEKLLLLFLSFVIIIQSIVLILHEKRLRSVEKEEFVAGKRGSIDEWSYLTRKFKTLKETINTGLLFALFLP